MRRRMAVACCADDFGAQFVIAFQVQDILSVLPDALPVAVGWGAHDRLLPVEGAGLIRNCKLVLNGNCRLLFGFACF